ncbi:putative mixed-linked glucan synthase 3 [Dissostichus eleginoides]|uniref:Mixed-linked glucan synthase 3 n=1 Tax=Dissostichus eleginoides TaxID=100907 RepID=A0AAD9CQ39_DISEL|nr:putative mixed-linked glucan synthase 3 [Dissostichus eleginoides]
MQAQTLFHQDLFHSFEAMKTAAPGMSRQAFTAMLDQRTKQFGRVSTNVKLKDKYMSEEPGFFDGVFLAQDSEVSTFVEDVRGAVKSTAGKAMCCESHWTAARETSK